MHHISEGSKEKMAVIAKSLLERDFVIFDTEYEPNKQTLKAHDFLKYFRTDLTDLLEKIRMKEEFNLEDLITMFERFCGTISIEAQVITLLCKDYTPNLISASSAQLEPKNKNDIENDFGKYNEIFSNNTLSVSSAMELARSIKDIIDWAYTTELGITKKDVRREALWKGLQFVTTPLDYQFPFFYQDDNAILLGSENGKSYIDGFIGQVVNFHHMLHKTKPEHEITREEDIELSNYLSSISFALPKINPQDIRFLYSWLSYNYDTMDQFADLTRQLTNPEQAFLALMEMNITDTRPKPAINKKVTPQKFEKTLYEGLDSTQSFSSGFFVVFSSFKKNLEETLKKLGEIMDGLSISIPERGDIAPGGKD